MTSFSVYFGRPSVHFHSVKCLPNLGQMYVYSHTQIQAGRQAGKRMESAATGYNSSLKAFSLSNFAIKTPFHTSAQVVSCFVRLWVEPVSVCSSVWLYFFKNEAQNGSFHRFLIHIFLLPLIYKLTQAPMQTCACKFYTYGNCTSMNKSFNVCVCRNSLNECIC